MPVIDTNLLIRLEANDSVAASALRLVADEDLIVPAQVASEYLVRTEHPEAELTRLHAAFRIEHTTDEHLLIVARLAQTAFDSNADRRPRWGDMHIAAAAVLAGSYVITTNKRHFTQLGVAAWHYTKEPKPPKDAHGLRNLSAPLPGMPWEELDRRMREADQKKAGADPEKP